MFIDYSSKPPISAFADRGGHMDNYARVYNKTPVPDEARALAHYLAEYEDLGARHVVIKARDLTTTFAMKVSNEDVAEFCQAHGPRFIGLASVDPHAGMVAVREFTRAIEQFGLRGLNISGFELRMHPDDARLYPLYARCTELGVPVAIHCGTNFSNRIDHDLSHPRHLDAVLRHFPELKVIAGPPGWPWVLELMAIAMRHPNLLVTTAAVRPRLLQTPHSGYEPLLQYGRTVLKDRIIFGSAHPLMPVRRCLDEMAALPLPDDVRQAWMHDNAARVLGLENGQRSL